MNFKYCLNKFEEAVNALDKKLFAEKGIDVQTGIWLDAVVLRLQKNHWANTPDEKPHTGSAIFMGIWLDDKAIADGKLLYNIHALRLRQLKGYKLQSRTFATSFREKFKEFEHDWTNVNVQFAPQTLMQGWVQLNLHNLQNDVLKLANKFLAIAYLVDETLNEFKQ